MKYMAKPNTWFDEGTEAELLADFRESVVAPLNCGLFLGTLNGKLDEEVCLFDEFEIVEE